MIGPFLYRGTVVKSKSREISKYGWWKIEEKGHEVTLKGISMAVELFAVLVSKTHRFWVMEWILISVDHYLC